jgi:ParB-like chromosome segregation protein Spo0J
LLKNIFNMEIKEIKISELKPAEYNPRKWTEEEINNLKESIKRFGIVDPIIVNSAENRKNVVIGGHFRLKVAKDLGMDTVPVVYVNISDEQKEKELNLRLNKNLGEWDLKLLAEFDETLLKDVGFDGSELDNIFGMELDEEFDIKKEFEKSIKNAKGVKDGDLWQLGEHKLIIGDSTKRENWENLLRDERFDLMFTDPPYKIGYGIEIRKQKTKNGFKLQRLRTYPAIGITDAQGKEFNVVKPVFGAKKNRIYLGTHKRAGGVPDFDEWLSIANDFQNPKGANVMIFENWKNVVELWQAVEKYWRVCNMVIWHLPNRMQGFSRSHFFYNKYDIAIVGDKNGINNEEYEEEFDKFMQSDGAKFLETYEIGIFGQKGNSEWYKKENKKTLIEKDNSIAGKDMPKMWTKITDHITSSADNEKSTGQNLVFGTKPVKIIVPYIKALSPRDGIVMEPFGGSGSAIIACEIIKRKCRTIEIEPLYREVIINRWEKFTGKKAEKIN